MTQARIVVDTNVYVSRFLRPDSIAGQSVAHAWRHGVVLITEPCWAELREVLQRPKFAGYVQPGALKPFLRQVWEIAEPVTVGKPIRACRDAKDDKFLEAAVYGRAEALVTGDADLLALDPFKGIAVLTPGDYLARYA